MEAIKPTTLHLKKAEGLELAFSDGTEAMLPLRYLRKYCPCAGCQGERDLLGRTQLPIVSTHYDGPVTALSGELVGNYAMRVVWSDGHVAGIYTFAYLYELAQQHNRGEAPAR